MFGAGRSPAFGSDRWRRSRTGFGPLGRPRWRGRSERDGLL